MCRKVPSSAARRNQHAVPPGKHHHDEPRISNRNVPLVVRNWPAAAGNSPGNNQDEDGNGPVVGHIRRTHKVWGHNRALAEAAAEPDGWRLPAVQRVGKREWQPQQQRLQSGRQRALGRNGGGTIAHPPRRDAANRAKARTGAIIRVLSTAQLQSKPLHFSYSRPESCMNGQSDSAGSLSRSIDTDEQLFIGPLSFKRATAILCTARMLIQNPSHLTCLTS